MLRKEQNGISWLEFELLSDFKKLKHGVFLKHGGVSPPPYESLNFSFFSGDSQKNVKTNHHKVKEILNLPILSQSQLTHGIQAFEMTSQTQTQSPMADILHTSHPHIGLLMTHADCQVAIFYDPLLHVIANVHAGWRGSVQNIYAKTIHLMHLRYGSQPKDLLVAISPSLGPENAEFKYYREEIPEKYWSFQAKPAYFNFWEIGRFQLEEAGILSHHIQIAEICTFSNQKDFFSYRREKISGRHGTVVALT